MTSETTDRFAGSEVYDQFYYGAAEPHTANYVNYTEHSTPHWARPLAVFIAQHGEGPILEIGAAYGFLVRELNALHVPAVGVEWSRYAHERRVSPYVERADARALPFADRTFKTVVSLDLLEHFEPDDVFVVMDEMARVAKPAALMVHVIGAHNPAEDLSRHLSDPTHACHWSLGTYLEALGMRGFTVDEPLTRALQTHPVFAPTDWAGRIVALRRAA